MTPESKAACCGCPERLKYEKEHNDKAVPNDDNEPEPFQI